MITADFFCLCHDNLIIDLLIILSCNEPPEPIKEPVTPFDRRNLIETLIMISSALLSFISPMCVKCNVPPTRIVREIKRSTNGRYDRVGEDQAIQRRRPSRSQLHLPSTINLTVDFSFHLRCEEF